MSGSRSQKRLALNWFVSLLWAAIDVLFGHKHSHRASDERGEGAGIGVVTAT